MADSRRSRLRGRGGQPARKLRSRRSVLESYLADWGNKDAQDVLAALDYVVARGWPIPRDRRGRMELRRDADQLRDRAGHEVQSGCERSEHFEYLAGYGTDQYIREYEVECPPVAQS